MAEAKCCKKDLNLEDSTWRTTTLNRVLIMGDCIIHHLTLVSGEIQSLASAWNRKFQALSLQGFPLYNPIFLYFSQLFRALFKHVITFSHNSSHLFGIFQGTHFSQHEHHHPWGLSPVAFTHRQLHLNISWAIRQGKAWVKLGRMASCIHICLKIISGYFQEFSSCMYTTQE